MDTKRAVYGLSMNHVSKQRVGFTLLNYHSRIVDEFLNEMQHIGVMPERYTHDWIHERSDWAEKVMDKRKRFLEEEQA